MICPKDFELKVIGLGKLEKRKKQGAIGCEVSREM